MKRRLCVRQVIALSVVAIFLIPAALKAETKDVDYTIKKGDTLWTISSGKLKDPLLWPKLWKANSNVHNPHLIFPDQKIVIPGDLLKDGLRSGKKLVPVRKLSSRYLPSGTASPIVSREILLDSGYFSRSFVPLGKIESRTDDKTLFGNGDTIYVSSAARLIPDTKYYIGDRAEAVYNPAGKKELAGVLVKNELVGYLVKIKGTLQITGEENGKTKGLIIENFKEIKPGDVIINYYPITVPYAPVVERKPAISGVIVGIVNRRMPAGREDIVYINRGSAQGVEVGDLFTISSGIRPHAVKGSIQIFSVFDDASVAIIKKTEREVVPGDTFGN
jgi:hypothetical protein